MPKALVFGAAFPVLCELGPDRLVCDSADLLIDYSCLGCYYLVNDQAADSTLTIEASGTYWVEVGNDCGIREMVIRMAYQYQG